MGKEMELWENGMDAKLDVKLEVQVATQNKRIQRQAMGRHNRTVSLSLSLSLSLSSPSL